MTNHVFFVTFNWQILGFIYLSSVGTIAGCDA